jgi:hypothetical protein
MNINFQKLTISFAVLTLALFVLGADSVLAQKKKPVIRKKTTTVKKTGTTTTVVKKPTLYTVEQNARIRVRIEQELSSKTAKVGDTFTTKVVETVYSNTGVVVIPEGSTITGRVDAVAPAKKGGTPGAIEVSFIEVKLPNQYKRTINGSLVDLNSDDAKSDNESTAKGDKMKNRKIIFIGGGAGTGAIIGGIAGGGLGAAIGAGAGALGGYIANKQLKGEEAVVKSGTEFGVVLNQAISMPRFVEAESTPNN